MVSLSAQAQDPGMQAAQSAMEAAQIANNQALMDNQTALQTQFTQTMLEQQRLAMSSASNTWDANCSSCGLPAPSFSIASGTYSSIIRVEIQDQTPGAVIYYTTDGWMPTPSS